MLSSSQGGFIVGRENIKSRWENMDPITKVILVRATLHPDAPAALELSIARTRVLDYL